MLSFQIVPGRVLASGDVLNTYSVELAGGSIVRAGYQGNSRGTWGVVESGGFLPGQDVWVGRSTSPGEHEYTILVARSVANPDWNEDDAVRQSVGHLNQVGYKYGERLLGLARTDNVLPWAECRASDHAPTDIVAGEWGMFSPFGAGAWVGHFQAGIRAGDVCEVVCHTDDQLTRVSGHRLQVWSIAREEDDSLEGDSVKAVKRSNLYGSAALLNARPERFELGGGSYGGWHSFVRSFNGAASLSHSFQGANGALLWRSAHSIGLIRTGSLTFPEELLLPAEREAIKESAAVLREPDPVDQGVIDDIQTPRPGLRNADDEYNDHAVPVLSAFEVIQNMVWQAYNGVRPEAENKTGWSFLGGPSGQPAGVEGVGVALHGMWSKRVLYSYQYSPIKPPEVVSGGTCGLILAPNGDVLLRGTFGEQITLSRGSITISAPNDVLTQPGRNNLVIAGKNVVTKANEHIEMEANTGRVSIVASTQASLVGQGVLVQSTSAEYAVDLGEGYDQSVSGVVILSRNTIASIAPVVDLTGLNAAVSDSVTPESAIRLSAKQLIIETNNTRAVVSDEVIWTVGGATSTPLVLGEDFCVLPPIFTPELPCVQTASTGQHVAHALEAAGYTFTLVREWFQPDAVTPTQFNDLGFKWATSTQYGTDSVEDFCLYEQPWQRLYSAPGAPTPTTWVQSYMRDGSCCYPGSATWDKADDRLIHLPYSDWYDAYGQEYNRDLNEVSGTNATEAVTLPATVASTLNFHLIIRP